MSGNKSTSNISRQLKLQLYKKFKKIKHQNTFEQIFDVLKLHNQPFNANSNGVFFDINKLSPTPFHIINDIIDKHLHSLSISESETETQQYNNYSETEFEKKLNIISDNKKLNNKEIMFLKKLNS